MSNDPSSPQLPVPNSVGAYILFLIANRRAAHMLACTDDRERWQNGLDYLAKLGWQIDVDNNGTAYAANAEAPIGFSSYWEFLRHRTNAVENFRGVVRQFLIPRLSALTRRCAAHPINAVGPIGVGVIN